LPVPRDTTFDVDVDLRLRTAIPGELHGARPNILMFGDWGWQQDRTEAQQQRYRAFQRNSLQTGVPFVVIEIGAGTDLFVCLAIGQFIQYSFIHLFVHLLID